MSILGAIVRTKPELIPELIQRLGTLPGVDIAANPADGRLVVILEDAEGAQAAPLSAAQALAHIATWPEVLGTSLVYEYSGPDAPPPQGGEAVDYRSWRGSLAALRQASALEPR